MRNYKFSRGFSLVELMVTLTILIIVSAAVFDLLNAAQIRYRNEQQFLDSFQNARVGLDQIVQEIHNAGNPDYRTYPGATGHPVEFAGGSDPDTLQAKYANAFRSYLGYASYDGTPTGFSSFTWADSCDAMNFTASNACAVPGPFNFSMEMDLDPYNASCPNQVEIIEYELLNDPPSGSPLKIRSSTLMRSVSSKPKSASYAPAICQPLWTNWGFSDPGSGPTSDWVPFIENVVNYYPTENNLPVNSDPSSWVSCGDRADASGGCPKIFRVKCFVTLRCDPTVISNVNISLWVRSENPDLQTGQIRVINLQALAGRMNPVW